MTAIDTALNRIPVLKKSIALLSLLVVLIGGIVFQFYITALPDLERPVTIEGARFTTEAGSVSVRMVDRDGQPFTFGLRASDEFERDVFPVFYIRNPDNLPYMYWPNIGGPDERALFRFLEGWFERNVAPEVMATLAQGQGAGNRRAEELAPVYAVYSLLRERMENNVSYQ